MNSPYSPPTQISATQGTPYQNLDALLHSDYNFTVPQQEVLASIVEGKTNKEIASFLGVSIGAVKMHVSDIMQKTYAESRLDLIVLACTGNIPRLMEGYDAMKGPSDIPYNGSVDLSKYNLTDREKEVLNSIAIGRLNEEIASFLGVSINTVKMHIRSIIQKTFAKSSLELAVLAYTGKIPRLVEEGNGYNNGGTSGINSDLAVLTDREIEVSKLIAEGRSNKEIANRLSISVNTVKTRIREIRRKLLLNPVSRFELEVFSTREIFLE